MAGIYLRSDEGEYLAISIKHGVLYDLYRTTNKEKAEDFKDTVTASNFKENWNLWNYSIEDTRSFEDKYDFSP